MRAFLGCLAAACLALTAGACASTTPSATSSPSASASTTVATPTPTPTHAVPVADPPSAGCYLIDYQAAIAPTSPVQATPCRKKHTAQTYDVGQLDTVIGGHLLALDSTTVQNEVATTCPQQLGAYLGGTEQDLRLSMLEAVWFTPTVKEADAGADWYRCDVIAVGAADKLSPLPPRMRGLLTRPADRAAYGICGTAEPGTADFTRVVCSATHTWKAISTVDLGTGKYPGVGSVRAAGQTPCQDAGRNAASDKLDYQWSYQWPTRAQWRTGQTYGFCWAPDTATG